MLQRCEIPAPNPTALIVKADRLAADSLRAVLQRALPTVAVQIAPSADSATHLVAHGAPGFLVTGLDPSLEGDVLGLLARCAGRPQPRIMVIVAHEEGRLLTALTNLPVHSVFDAMRDDPRMLEHALSLLAIGGRYWSPSIWPRIRAFRAAAQSSGKALTPSEQRVLAIIGDGCDDTTAGEILGLRPTTVASVRRNLHRKLGIQHRGDLVRFAAQNGFVRFTVHGVVRPGFNLLGAASHAPKPPRTAKSAALL